MAARCVRTMCAVSAMPERADAGRAQDLPGALSSHARRLYEDTRLIPLLRRLMSTSCTITGAVGSSISIVDPTEGRYTKVAERGTACRLGESFPLDEGVTGRVMHSRRPVVLASYDDLATGHLPAGSRARSGAVLAIPIWWRGNVVGANVIFAGCVRSFASAEIDELEVVTQVVAPGIVTAAERDLGMTSLMLRPGPEARPGQERQCVSLAEVAQGLASLMTRAVPPDQGPLDSVHVRVVRDTGVRLEVKDSTTPSGRWRELVEDSEGVVRSVLAPKADGGPCPEAPSPPFTLRESQVAVLLGRGLTDRAIAQALAISPKTAEKHVGAVLRKTGTTSRTAAVVRALERGWLPEEFPPHP